MATIIFAKRLPQLRIAWIDNTAGEAALKKGYGKRDVASVAGRSPVPSRSIALHPKEGFAAHFWLCMTVA